MNLPGRQFMDGYATNLPLLVSAVMRVDGAVLELGCGEYSTLVLHEICEAMKRPLVSFEANNEWLSRFKPLASKHHDLFHVPNWATAPIEQPPSPFHRWGVAFVDHSHGDRRYLEIQRLADKAGVIVVHDTENCDYVYDHVMPSFEYAYTDNRLRPWTTAVSNFIDLSSWGPCPKEYIRVGFPKH